jgi:hypothetical protein
VQKRTRYALAFAAAAVVAAAGITLFATRRPHPGSLDAIPAGALLVATADLAALRASPVGAPFLREGREIPGLGKVRDVCGFDPMDTLTEVTVAIPAAGDSGEFGLAASGPIDADALIACASKVIDARGGRAVTTALGSFRSVRDAALATTGGEIAVRKGGPLLLGAGSYLRAMIDAADGQAPSIRSSVAHGFLGHELGDASLRVTVVLSPALRHTLTDELANDGAAGSPAGSIVAGALGMTLGPFVGLHVVVSCESTFACARLADALGSARDARVADVGTRIMGFSDVLSQIKITAEGELVHARVNVPSDQAAQLAERLVALRGMRHPMPKDEPTGSHTPPLPPDEVIKPSGDGGMPVDAGKR